MPGTVPGPLSYSSQAWRDVLPFPPLADAAGERGGHTPVMALHGTVLLAGACRKTAVHIEFLPASVLRCSWFFV